MCFFQKLYEIFASDVSLVKNQISTWKLICLRRFILCALNKLILKNIYAKNKPNPANTCATSRLNKILLKVENAVETSGIRARHY